MDKKTIFTKKIAQYITNEMQICIDDLTKKILNDVPDSADFFNRLFEYMISLKVPYEYENTVMSYNNDENRSHINKMLYNFLEDNDLNEDSDEHFIFDNIRHAFINFKKGGILNMYQYREAEGWYPKVIINSFLGDKEDINTLNFPVQIYRGTSLDEFNSKNFGQSWSISKKIAEEFAFIHYRSQPNYQDSMRVILSTTVDKKDIFYYVENGIEEEVIIDSKKLEDVHIIDQKLMS